MAIEFYDISDVSRRNILFDISNKDFDFFEKIVSELRKSTGVCIDPYSTSRLYRTHVIKLIELLKKELSSDTTTRQEHKVLTTILQKFSNVSTDLLIIGD
ncbi:hypothetical protein ACFQZI_12330 [Mucilaginibacter lutimaris]|uniref:Uncharacterized protein n=1 Tax=Mucilaginibacter lutimaris TaxID=931629 RepID=A0ABW2ZHH1_9SPHI